MDDVFLIKFQLHRLFKRCVAIDEYVALCLVSLAIFYMCDLELEGFQLIEACSSEPFCENAKFWKATHIYPLGIPTISNEKFHL